MTFKKNLKTGQASLEYFILLAMITFTAVCLFNSASFNNQVKDILQGENSFFTKAVGRILQ